MTNPITKYAEVSKIELQHDWITNRDELWIVCDNPYRSRGDVVLHYICDETPHPKIGDLVKITIEFVN